MNSALEFVDVIIALEESQNADVKSVRLGKAIYAELIREIGPRCVFPVNDLKQARGVEVRGVPVWCDPTIDDDAGDVIVARR